MCQVVGKNVFPWSWFRNIKNRLCWKVQKPLGLRFTVVLWIHERLLCPWVVTTSLFWGFQNWNTWRAFMAKTSLAMSSFRIAEFWKVCRTKKSCSNSWEDGFANLTLRMVSLAPSCCVRIRYLNAEGRWMDTFLQLKLATQAHTQENKAMNNLSRGEEANGPQEIPYPI